MSKEASVKSRLSTLDRANTAHIAKIIVPCDQKGTAHIWGYFLRIESSVEKAIDRGSTTMPNNARTYSR
jgi:hypothetical protein